MRTRTSRPFIPPALLPALHLTARLVLVASVFGCLGARPGSAQVLYGSIVGHAEDGTGGAVPGAVVTITSTETSFSRSAVTNENGGFTFTNVQAGVWLVRISLQGFKDHVTTDVPVTVNTVSRVDVRLEVGTITEAVMVESQSALLQADKADTHTEIKSQAITQLPLDQNRNYQTLINLVPGATPARQQNSEVDTPGRALTTNVNGLDRNNNGTRTDGATNVNIWLPHHTMYVSPAETIDTVNVSTSNFDAEQGNAGGAAITVITKSGTNELKGSAFAFYNDERLNARPYFATEKPKASAHIDGVTAGGPLSRDRLFFFGAWEGQYQRTPQQFFSSVPPDALRAGDFSQAHNPDGSLQIIYNPFTGNADGTGREPFPGNIIPSDLISPIARRIQDLYPAANLPGDLSGGDVGGRSIHRNYARVLPREFTRNNYDVKVNWNLSRAAQAWGKFSRMGAAVTSPRGYLGYDGLISGDTTVNQYTVGTTWTLDARTVLDGTLGISTMKHASAGGDIGLGNVGLDTLGIPGMNGGRNFSGDRRYAGIPGIISASCWCGFDIIGDIEPWFPVERDERTYAFASNLTRLHGAHELRAGYSLNRLRMDHWQPEIGAGPRGWVEAASNATALNAEGAQMANAYNGYASLLLGLLDYAAVSAQNELMTTREWQHAMYARDRWQISSKLTLDLGLRYEYYPLVMRADRGIERIEGATTLEATRQLRSLTVLLGGVGGNPKDLGIHVSKTLFAPRLGAVYRINEATVFRAGWGVTYNPLPFSRPLRGFYPLTLSTAYYTADPYGWVTTLDRGIPDIVRTDESSGRLPLPNSYDMRTPAADVSRSRIQSWNVSFERRLPFELSVDVAYVGTAKHGGFADIDANASDTPGGGRDSRPFYARIGPDGSPIGRYSPLYFWSPFTKSRYHSLQVALNRPFKNGLMLKGAYTLSRAMNETDEDGWDQVMFNSPSQMGRNYALAGYDRTHIFQMAFVYELPYKTSTPGGHRLLKAVLGDWQVNGIYGAFSGTPFTILASDVELSMPGTPQTANLNGSYTVIGKRGDAGPYFDTAAFSQPEGTTFGNTGRNQFRGPGMWNLDLSIFRKFPLHGRRRIELRAEFFNLTNTPSWGNPDGYVESGTFGRTYWVGGNGGGWGLRDAGTGERQIRLGLRMEF